MKRLILLAVLAPALASAQIQASASFTLDLPVIIPPLVVIQPGIRVVPDVDVEVFQVDGAYWTQRDGSWYRSSNPRAGWVHHPRGYPPGLTKFKPGQYKRWKGGHAKSEKAMKAEKPGKGKSQKGGGKHGGRGN